MQGYQIVIYENASVEGHFQTPVGADRVIKYWRATRKKAQQLKDELHQEYDAIIWIKNRA